MRSSQFTPTNSPPRIVNESSAATSLALNISQLTERLWTGGDLPDHVGDAVATVEAWRELGIRQIIDNRIEWSDENLVEASAPEIRYFHNGIDDAGQRMPDEWFDTVVAVADAGLKLDGGVLVHCHMGINRGPSAAYAVLLTQGWDPVEAIDLIRTARPVAAVGYAEDALNWWHRTNATDQRQRRAEQARLTRWRANHPHDTIRIIREIRAKECAR